MFRGHQLEAIGDLVEGWARVLCVQRTGWGKSAVYLHRDRCCASAARGPTLIVSPLLALMRNQIAAAQQLGIRADDHLGLCFSPPDDRDANAPRRTATYASLPPRSDTVVPAAEQAS